MYNEYPYTDFHELNLDWFLAEFKQVHDHVDDLDATVTEFTTFVTNYFDDLDVQQEINNKLDALVADGTIANLLLPLTTDTVEDWLEEHITPTTPPVDDTLTISGAAADAKVTGEKISNLKDGIIRTSDELNYTNYSLKFGWVDGLLNTNTGAIESNNYHVTIDGLIPLEVGRTLRLSANVQSFTLYRCLYDENGSYISGVIINITEGQRDYVKSAGDAAYYIKYSISRSVYGLGVTLGYTDSVIDEIHEDIATIDKEVDARLTAIVNNKKDPLYYFGNVNGTLSETITTDIPAGTYAFSCSNLVSSDTDSSTSLVALYHNSTTLASLSVNRGEPSDIKFAVTSSITSIRVYASDGYSHSTGDTFTYSDLAITVATDLYTHINSIDLYKQCFDNSSSTLNPKDFEWGGIYQGELYYYQRSFMLVTPDIHYTEKDITIRTVYPVLVRFVTYDSEGVWTGYDSADHTIIRIPSGSYYRLVIRDSTVTTGYLNPFETFKSVKLSQNPEAIPEYYYKGNELPLKRKGYWFYTMFSGDYTFEGTALAQQGMAIYNNVIVVGFSQFGTAGDANKLRLYDINTGATIASLDCTIGHANVLSFSNDFYAENDEFPLLYCGGGVNPAYVQVIRLTRSSATVIRTLSFGDVSVTGYYGNPCIDKDTGNIVMMGYTNNDILTDANNNKIKVTVWDSSDLTADGNYYRPSMVESYEMPFIYVLQDQKILNNHLYVSSSSNVGNTNIYVIDLTTKTISTIISDFRSAIKDHELEGIDFIPYETRYNLILHVQNGSFYTMWFER